MFRKQRQKSSRNQYACLKLYNSMTFLFHHTAMKTGLPTDGLYTNAKLKTFVRSEVFTAVTMTNAAFWYIKTKFIFHRK
jgi:hypothetical protein